MHLLNAGLAQIYCLQQLGSLCLPCILPRQLSEDQGKGGWRAWGAQRLMRGHCSCTRGRDARKLQLSQQVGCAGHGQVQAVPCWPVQHVHDALDETTHVALRLGAQCLRSQAGSDRGTMQQPAHERCAVRTARRGARHAAGVGCRISPPLKVPRMLLAAPGRAVPHVPAGPARFGCAQPWLAGSEGPRSGGLRASRRCPSGCAALAGDSACTPGCACSCGGPATASCWADRLVLGACRRELGGPSSCAWGAASCCALTAGGPVRPATAALQLEGCKRCTACGWPACDPVSFGQCTGRHRAGP